ncbi:sugar phosphotransferase [Pelomyxa schiedti]|nr:sugar phosphotransferase [Pelomyxa schiedti]
MKAAVVPPEVASHERYRRAKQLTTAKRCAIVLFMMCLLLVNAYFLIETGFLNALLFSCGTKCTGERMLPEVAQRDVDLVISWVDGGDPSWVELKQKYLPPRNSKDALGAKRWRNNNEVCYLLRSIKKYAPWIRHIWIATLNQVPVCLNVSATSWISVVNHSEFMREIDQPNFSSHAIEASIHRIPGLSEYFLYNNDDMLFYQPLVREDIFTWDGKMRFYVFGWRQILNFIPVWSSYVHTYCVRVTARSFLKQFPASFPHKQMHQSMVMSKSLLEETWRLYPDEMNATAIAKFRDIHTVIPLTLAFETGLGLGDGERDFTTRQELLKLTNSKGDDRKFAKLKSSKPRWLCLNDDSNSDSPVNWHVVNFLRHEYPEPGPWEPPHWESEWLATAAMPL